MIFVGDRINLPAKSVDDIDMKVPGLVVEPSGSGVTKPTAPTKPVTPVATTIPTKPANPVKPADPVPDETPAVSNNSSNKKSPYTSAYSDERARQSVNYIIRNDKNKFKINEAVMTEKIVAAAKKADIKADSLAAIVKNETHFCDRMLCNEWGKGPTGITSIVPKDMFARPAIYDPGIAELLKDYGTLENLFKAKDKNPILDLGTFGDMLYKYKTPKNLNEGARTDFDLNLQIGAFTYKYQIMKYKGNEQLAFKNYNGSFLKESYARKAVATVQDARNNN